MRRIPHLLAGLMLTAAATLSFTVSSPALADDDDYVPGEVLVQLAGAGDLSGVAGTHGLDPQPISQFGQRAIYRMRIIDQVSPETKVDQLQVDGRVLRADPNYVGQTPEGGSQSSWAVGGDEGGYRTQWAPEKMRLPQAHGANARGAGVTVAVLDTGVDPSHPALAGRLVPGRDFVDLDDDPREVGTARQDIGFGHGTHVAGLVALAAPEAKIMPLRVLDPAGRGNLWVLAEALEYAIDPDGRPETTDGAQVINLSISFRHDPGLLEDLLEDATCAEAEAGSLCQRTGGRGVVVVAAAGNRGGTAPEYPAAEEDAVMLAVAASTSNDTLAPFSSRGPWVDVMAPGEGILSSVPGGQYGTWSGSSMATGLAAGQAALVRGKSPEWRAAQVVQQIVNTAAPIDGPVPRRIDAAAAVAAGSATAPVGGSTSGSTSRASPSAPTSPTADDDDDDDDD